MEDVISPLITEHTVEKDNTEVITRLLENSKAAIMGAVELHNKPVFPYRYEISVILTINAWELALKAFILKYQPEVKVVDEDKSKEFLNCIGCVMRKLGRDFMPQKENLELVYKYRCDIIHFYGQGVELILYSLLRPNIIYFSEFLKVHFEIDLSEEANLIILPIGFKRIVSPIDFLSETIVEGNDTVKDFIKSIAKSAKELEDNGFSDGLISNYAVSLERVDKVKNADIVLGLTNDPTQASIHLAKLIKKGSFTFDKNAPSLRIDEESVFKEVFTLPYKDFLQKLKEEIPGFRENQKNMRVIAEQIKTDPNCFRLRYLDVIPHAKSTKKPYYSQAAIDKAIELFKKEQ